MNVDYNVNIQEMTPLTDSESKILLIDMLMAFDKFCRENNLCYFLSDGTLLGAIRHKGFIPWDDDADVYMLREDYEKLIQYQEINQEIDVV